MHRHCFMYMTTCNWARMSKSLFFLCKRYTNTHGIKCGNFVFTVQGNQMKRFSVTCNTYAKNDRCIRKNNLCTICNQRGMSRNVLIQIIPFFFLSQYKTRRRALSKVKLWQYAHSNFHWKCLCIEAEKVIDMQLIFWKCHHRMKA